VWDILDFMGIYNHKYILGCMVILALQLARGKLARLTVFCGRNGAAPFPLL
jgi:hypothetical protein